MLLTAYAQGHTFLVMHGTAWHIVYAFADHEGFYVVELERAPGEGAYAELVITDRNAREPAHAGWDPRVGVLKCSDESAREWLEAAEHEYAVAETVVEWSSLRRVAS